ncbi:CubicO group peptidase, beta-lactamase class C family [Rhizobiales bacterium GAS191]|nr:CubicO group peptidase, beta-lactamase class C family [Rhizobiales bacterium GAS113]SED23861.1 CubicO group peptidase, beta-lactamase class C family [Rhizobiales bacterium GAS191]
MNVIHKPIHAMLPETTPEEAGLSPQGLAKLTAVMRREVETKHVPGVSMLISRGGKIAFRENVGALRPGGPAMRSDGIFRIYSMTKPIVSVAIMTLVEDGLLWLSDPVAKFIPEMSNPQVGVEKNGKLELVPAERPITIQDLLRHTSGLTYGFLGTSVVQRLYAEAPLRSQDITSAGHVAALAKLPLLDQPGTHWHYSHSTDVLGRVVEIISGETLGAFLKERILGPLGMVDTGFHAPADKHERLAEPFPVDPDTGAAVELIETRVQPLFESGGGGLVSTLEDYARFLHMLYYGGTLDGVRFLGRKTVAFMASDHLGPHVAIGSELLPPGHGFGLGFAVRRENGMAPTPGTVGEFFWGGIAGTAFWIAPQEELVALMMVQAPGQRDYYRQLFRNLVHAALA